MSAPRLHQALSEVFDVQLRMRRNVAHVLGLESLKRGAPPSPSPDPWKRAAAQAYATNAAECARLADGLAELPVPTDPIDRALADARARWLRKSLDRLRRLMTERAHLAPNDNCDRTIEVLGCTLQRIAIKATGCPW